MQKIGLSSLSNNQLVCIGSTPLLMLIGCIELFILWIECGYYDFCNFSATVKDKMSSNDISSLEATLQNGNRNLMSKVDNLLFALKEPLLVADIEQRAIKNHKVSYLCESVLHFVY